MTVEMVPVWPGTCYLHLTKYLGLVPLAVLTRSAGPGLGGRQGFPGVPMRQLAPPAWAPLPEAPAL